MMSVDERHADLTARCWQTQQTLDNAVKDVERAMRFYDRVPDGDRRRTEATRRMSAALDRKNVAERAAGKAADALLAFEAQHGAPPPHEQPQLPQFD